MLLPLHLNLQAAAPLVAEAVVDKGRDAGSGRKQWWEGEWIIPGVDAYLPEKPPEDITPLRPKVERVKQRLRQARPALDAEYFALQGKLGALVRSVGALERQAEAAARAREIEAAIQAAVAQYRVLSARAASIESEIAQAEALSKRRRLLREDEEFITLLMEM